MKAIVTKLILKYIRFFAKLALKKNRPTIIGIAGSYGKSTAKDLLYSILKDYYITKKIEGNSETGIPLGILNLEIKSLGYNSILNSIIDWIKIIFLVPFSTNTLKDIKYLIIEMGVDDPYPPKNMEYLLTIGKPDISLFLNADAVHTQQFEKLLVHSNLKFSNNKEKIEYLIQQIANEKAKIITKSGCKIGIYNTENKYIVNSLKKFTHAKTVLIPFGGKNARIKFKKYQVSLEGTQFIYNFDNKDLSIIFKDYLLPKKFHETLSAVLVTATEAGLSREQIQKAFNKYLNLPKSRASILIGIRSSTIIDSSYNASRTTVEETLNLLAELKKLYKRPTAFLFGDMRELGSESKSEHEQIANKMIGIVDNLYTVGPLTREYIFPIIENHRNKFKEVRWFDSANRAGEFLHDNLFSNTILLVKGSQNTIFLEEAIKYLLKDKKDFIKLCRQDKYWLNRKAIRN